MFDFLESQNHNCFGMEGDFFCAAYNYIDRAMDQGQHCMLGLGLYAAFVSRLTTRSAVCGKLHARAGRRCVALRTQAAVTFAPALIACPASKISGHCLSLCVCVLTTRSSLTLPSSGHSGKVSRLSVTAACRRLPCCSEL
jgi:hypothetical protein